MLSFISNCIIDQVSEILLEAIVAASEEQEQTVSFADTVSCKILSNSVLRSVFEINEQLSCTCFIGSKGLNFVPAPAHTVCLSWLCNHSLDVTRKNHPAERIIPGCPRSTRLLYRGRISFFFVIKFYFGAKSHNSVMYMKKNHSFW